MEKKEGSQEAAARMAREAAERARRAEIMSQIHKIEKEIEECEDLKENFSGMRGNLSTNIAQLNNYTTIDLQPNPQYFEGITSAATGVGLAEAQSAIGKSGSCFADVESAIGTQIGLLNKYIAELRQEIHVLQARM